MNERNRKTYYTCRRLARCGTAQKSQRRRMRYENMELEGVIRVRWHFFAWTLFWEVKQTKGFRGDGCWVCRHWKPACKTRGVTKKRERKDNVNFLAGCYFGERNGRKVWGRTGVRGLWSCCRTALKYVTTLRSSFFFLFFTISSMFLEK